MQLYSVFHRQTASFKILTSLKCYIATDMVYYVISLRPFNANKLPDSLISENKVNLLHIVYQIKSKRNCHFLIWLKGDKLLLEQINSSILRLLNLKFVQSTKIIDRKSFRQKFLKSIYFYHRIIRMFVQFWTYTCFVFIAYRTYSN